MKSYYSLIRYCNNSLSNENIVIGLVAISETNFFFKFSDFKINLITKLNLSNSNDLIKYNVKKFDSLLKSVQNDEIFNIENCVNIKKLLGRLSVYNNGVLQFDKPHEVDILFDENVFHNFYSKAVGEQKIRKRINYFDKIFQKRIDNDFKLPLCNKIDLDYTIDSDIIPSLFFDYKLNGIGANGSVYSVKCIDLNSNRTIDNIRKDVAELESLSVRLNDFSEKFVKKPKNNKHYLVMDKYVGNDLEMKDLYNSLKGQSSGFVPYEMIESSELSRVSNSLLNSNVKKFSEIFN